MAASKNASVEPEPPAKTKAEPVDLSAAADEFERLKALNQVDTPRFVELKHLLSGG